MYAVHVTVALVGVATLNLALPPPPPPRISNCRATRGVIFFKHMPEDAGWKANFIISYHIISYHIISYHIISYHIITYYIISNHIISYHIISYHIISYHIISYHIISYIYQTLFQISNFIPISYIKTKAYVEQNMILRTWSKGHKGLGWSCPLNRDFNK